MIPQEFYDQLKCILPIACVDLLVVDNEGCVLLLKRKNEPARGQWWFPGGRVFWGETRKEAAKRKLHEECGIYSERDLFEIGTYDLFFNYKNSSLHNITTVYSINVLNAKEVKTDSQSTNAKWQSVNNWMNEELHPFLRNILSSHLKIKEKRNE